MSRRARNAIEAAGGIAGKRELADRWEISKQRVGRLAQDPTFPKPVGVAGGSPVWLVDEADEWRSRRPGHAGRPRRVA